jgi:predicted metal-dependent phosphoesterase TrpH
MKADLHIHTTASDGALSPSQAVEAGLKAGLAAIAVTDHDTVSGIDEALSAAEGLEIEIVPGIEISTLTDDNVEVHVLGYFFDHRNEPLLGRLQVLRNARWDRARKMVEQLNAVGVRITMDRVAEIAGGGAVGRPHVARAIVEAKAASGMDSAFGKFLIEGCPGFVPRYKISPTEAVAIIRQAGGIASCGHVAKLKRDDIVLALVKEGLQAIEVYHPDHGPMTRRFYRKFAEKHGLIITGGSDAHGFDGTKANAVGSVAVVYETVDQLRKAASRH